MQKQPFVDAFQNRCFLKFKNFALVTGQHLCWSLFKIKFRSIIRFPVTVVKIQEQFFYRISPVVASGFTENGWVFVYELIDSGFESRCCHLKREIWRQLRAGSSLTFRQTREFEFTLKLVRDMLVRYSFN